MIRAKTSVARCFSTLTRSSHYAKFAQNDLQYFKSFLPPNAVISDPQDQESYNRDWYNNYTGNAAVVLRPGTTEEVSRILQYCNERHLAVVPQGGNTGLVLGSIPIFDEIVISLNRMKRIISFDDASGIVSAEAGVIKEELDNFLLDKGYILPYDLAAKGSCSVGGNVATNAGGVRLIRYGSLRGSTVGLKAVLPNGTVIDSMMGLLKDNTGYDVKQMFIGSEGTLGVITEVQLVCPVAPKQQAVAMVACSSFQHVLNILKVAKRKLGDLISAIQYLDSLSFDCSVEQLKRESPFSEKYPFYLLIETSSSDEGESYKDVLLSLLSEELAQQIQDGVISTNEQHFTELWAIREDIALASNMNVLAAFPYDVTLAQKYQNDLVQLLRSKFGSDNLKIMGFGHIGDGNLHLVIQCFTEKEKAKVATEIDPFLFEYISEKRGSVSAEHGVGHSKINYLPLSKSPESLRLMKKVKNLYDPNGIMNPYKLLQ